MKKLILICLFSLPAYLFANNQAQPNASNIALNKAVYHQVKQYYFCPFWDANYINEIKMYSQAGHLATDGNPVSAWMTYDTTSWLYVDLHANATIEKLVINWKEMYASQYAISVSGNAREWKEVYSAMNGQGKTETIAMAPVQARYVKISCNKSANNGYAISEFEVFGTGGYEPKAIAVTSPAEQNHLYLTGGNWKVQKASFVGDSGAVISKTGFSDKGWIPATVPATVLTSYLHAGAIPDHNYAEQQLMISDTFFTAKFWYRNEFVVPAGYKGFSTWLNLDGINYRADVYVNGKFLGKINDVFKRTTFDITPYVAYGEKNGLAVLIYPPNNPGLLSVQDLKSIGANSGVLSQDSPTFFSSLGWDWIPTIRGRNIGLWNHVHLSKTGPVKMMDPYVTSDLPLPALSPATIALQVELENTSGADQPGLLKGVIGDITFEKNVVLKAQEKKMVVVNATDFKQLVINDPKLWWPNGYGDQHLYKLTLSFQTGNPAVISDIRDVTFGIREITCDLSDNILKLKVNGHRIFVRGGNWGMPEAMLNIDKEGYENRVKLHKDLNFNMIRNWVGQTAHREFFDACDKYGILVWDEFWLSNEFRGYVPADYKKFMASVPDKIKTDRTHASVALYCGRNENNPPESLKKKLGDAIRLYDSTRLFVPSSIHPPVSGSGPWSLNDPKWYFKNRGGAEVPENNNNYAIYSELGVPNVPPLESMLKMMPADKLWPQNDLWGLHDFSLNNAQDCRKYNAALVNHYGPVDNIVDFCLKSQLLNMESHKAMFEAYASKEKSNGVLMWMSQSAWPSLVWQTYDYFYEPTAGYFGCKKASEPLHILWDCLNETVLVRNATVRDYKNLTAEIRIYNQDGTLKQSETKTLDIVSDKVEKCFDIKYPAGLTKLHFIKLSLKEGEKLLSDNFYWREPDNLDYSDLNHMIKVKLLANVQKVVSNGICTLTVNLQNPTSNIAVMTRLKVIKATSKTNVLPLVYEDNYFSLLPGENKKVTITFDQKYAEGENTAVVVEGWKVFSGEVVQTAKLSPLKELSYTLIAKESLVKKLLEVEAVK